MSYIIYYANKATVVTLPSLLLSSIRNQGHKSFTIKWKIVEKKTTTYIFWYLLLSQSLSNSPFVFALFTIWTRIGVSSPSRARSPLAKAAAVICTRPSSEAYIFKSCRNVECNRSSPNPWAPAYSPIVMKLSSSLRKKLMFHNFGNFNKNFCSRLDTRKQKKTQNT